jgi:hypothetical protein
MVLADALRARLLAALRLWLAADPAELRVEPGLLQSHVIARGVELDVSALNGTAVESLPARFDRAAIAEIELVASPWAGPAVRAVVRGVDVDLTLRYRSASSACSCTDSLILIKSCCSTSERDSRLMLPFLCWKIVALLCHAELSIIVELSTCISE